MLSLISLTITVQYSVNDIINTPNKIDYLLISELFRLMR